MKVIVNEYIPFKGFIAFNFFGIIFVRLDEYLKFDKLHNKHAYDVILNHEKIHTEQMKELLYIFFYLIYCVEYLIKFICCFNFHKAYHNVSFEKEAFDNEFNLKYLENRKRYNWIKYLFHCF